MKLTRTELNNCFKSAENKIHHNQNLFFLISPKYNLATKLLSFNQDKKWKKELIKLLPELETPVCLDIACGTGDITFEIAQKYKNAKIFGLDVTQSMLDQAIKLNNFDNIKFICQDMANTNFGNNTFDLITGSYALRNSPDLQKTLFEMSRILKKDGIFAVLDFSRFDNFYMQKIQYFLINFWGCLWGLLLHNNHTIYSYIARSLKFYPSNSEFNKMIKDYGFEILRNKKYFLGTIQVHILKKL